MTDPGRPDAASPGGPEVVALDDGTFDGDDAPDPGSRSPARPLRWLRHGRAPAWTVIVAALAGAVLGSVSEHRRSATDAPLPPAVVVAISATLDPDQAQTAGVFGRTRGLQTVVLATLVVHNSGDEGVELRDFRPDSPRAVLGGIAPVHIPGRASAEVPLVLTFDCSLLPEGPMVLTAAERSDQTHAVVPRLTLAPTGVRWTQLAHSCTP